MRVAVSQLSVIRALPHVSAANPGAERMGAPVDTVAVTDFANGLNTWDLDAISVAASGWVGEWTAASWWRTLDVPDPTKAADYYITDFSSREKPGQDLDVAAPGSWVVGPYQTQSGKISYYYLGAHRWRHRTSQGSPR